MLCSVQKKLHFSYTMASLSQSIKCLGFVLPLAMFTILMAVSINCYLDFSTHISGYLGKIFEMPPDLSTASEVSLKTRQFPRCHPHRHPRRHKLGCHGHSFSRKCRIWMSTTYFSSAVSVARFLDFCRSWVAPVQDVLIQSWTLSQLKTWKCVVPYGTLQRKCSKLKWKQVPVASKRNDTYLETVVS